MSRSQLSQDRTRSRSRKEQSRYYWSRSWRREGAVPLYSKPEPEPVFGTGTGSGTEFITKFNSILPLNTKCMKQSDRLRKGRSRSRKGPVPDLLVPEPNSAPSPHPVPGHVLLLFTWYTLAFMPKPLKRSTWNNMCSLLISNRH
jgi:hypothetical protein